MPLLHSDNLVIHFFTTEHNEHKTQNNQRPHQNKQLNKYLLKNNVVTTSPYFHNQICPKGSDQILSNPLL
ncbi:hypothetical protein DMR_30020 [Solidesulfovibrio magneticus RS-1]|uniref:Uncharacterized protein n=1 Tax=Solidesulfovibrio magneticus (strain ATCC 700980 / DSM 13731 / RS-1) TaxID=573370 RepID=C4XHX6_SOLM1|nr:hypothetical protein DMR_30020 [Solidesulfovibrio magneticus RS-1]